MAREGEDVNLEDPNLETTRHNFWVHRQALQGRMDTLDTAIQAQHESIRTTNANIQALMAASDARMERRFGELQDLIINNNNRHRHHS